MVEAVIGAVLTSVASSAVTKLIGGSEKAPATSNAAVEDTQAEEKKAQLARASLFSTEGGAIGDELQSGEVQQRNTLFGN